jgi:hypothetical protein
MEEYADPVIDWLDAGRGILARRFFRDVGRFVQEFIPFADLLHTYSLVLSFLTDHIPKIYRLWSKICPGFVS